MFIRSWFDRLVRWLRSFFRLEVSLSEPKRASWVIVPMTYEKWVNPSNKNDKHYRVIFRSPTGRRYGKTKFKTATRALEFAREFNLYLCGKREMHGS